MLDFPKGFFWGAAISAYQVEGNNIHSDWWEWEKRTNRESSGSACRHYEFYLQDFDLAKELNHNALRFSIEWSRIEPEEGRFSEEEIKHYQKVILALKERNLEPIVTLHHFTHPLWFSQLGGWQNKDARFYFLRYVEKIVSRFSNYVKFWITINEPLVYVYHAYILGAWPPQERSFLKAKRVEENLFSSHLGAYRLIHQIYKKNGLPQPLVSIAKNMQVFMSCYFSLRNKIATYLRDYLFNFRLLNRLIHLKALDFIGLNYYTRSLVEVKGWMLHNLLLDVCKSNHSKLKKNSLGWDIYPEGLYYLLLRLKKYNLPVFILENGICTDDDNLRWDFIYEHIKNISQAIKEGVNILGYLYWSLIDNYEWDKGFSPRFGLVALDYNSYQRIVRESAKKFSLVCKQNAID